VAAAAGTTAFGGSDVMADSDELMPEGTDELMDEDAEADLDLGGDEGPDDDLDGM
jgi:hypothetical protein